MSKLLDPANASRAEQLQSAPNVGMPTAEIEEFSASSSTSWTLAKRAKQLIKVTAYQVITSDSQEATLSGGNTFVLDDCQNHNFVIKHKTSGLVYDSYSLTITDKSYTVEEPTNPTTTVNVNWIQKYIQVPTLDSNGNYTYDQYENLITHPEPDGVWPNNGDPVVIDFHGFGEVKDAVLSSDRYSVSIPANHRVEPNAKVSVQYESGSTPFLNNNNPVPNT